MTSAQFLNDLDIRCDERKYSIINSSAEIKPAGNVHYVSNDGNDKNSGSSPDSAWATLDRVNFFFFDEGDAVLFARGDLWRGQLQCQGGVTYSAFGTGEKPKIYGSDYNYAQSIWEKTWTPHVYVLSLPLSEDAGLIVFDYGKAHSYKKITGIDGFNGNLDSLINDLDMYHGDDHRIYLRSDTGNPSARFRDIEIAAHRHAITVAGDNVTINNLCIMYTGSHGIGTANRKGLAVQNCVFGWIGGSIQNKGSSTRYGNAIEIYVSCRNFTVENCYIYQVYDAAITHQFKLENKTSVIMENVTYRGNLIENCSYSIEYFLEQSDNNNQIMRNILIEDNICRFSGFGWGDQRPDKNTPAHLKGWNHKNPSDRFVIRNNVFDRSRYMMIHCGADDPKHLPVFRDNTFIQFKGGVFGKYGKNPPDMTIYGDIICSGFFDSEIYSI